MSKKFYCCRFYNEYTDRVEKMFFDCEVNKDKERVAERECLKRFGFHLPASNFIVEVKNAL